MAGDQVLMVSGSDMHGTPITVAADKLGVSARELAEANHLGIAESFRRLGLSYDLYTTTDSDPLPCNAGLLHPVAGAGLPLPGHPAGDV